MEKHWQFFTAFFLGLLKPKMKCPEAPAQQAGDVSIPLAGVYPGGEDLAPNHPEGVVWETSSKGEASSCKVNSQAGRLLAAQAQVSLLYRQESNVGRV